MDTLLAKVTFLTEWCSDWLVKPEMALTVSIYKEADHLAGKGGLGNG